MESKPKIFAASGSLPLAEKIAQAYGTKLGKVELSRFSDGEFQPCFEETVHRQSGGAEDFPQAGAYREVPPRTRR